ncbi:hypothetical protein [Leucobacter musarum]|uniref:hypothetical protein n=1 Tax=Leucobacter musarum TaxID=1930747 RepID=UPI0006A77F35|nr:hypothetical protein [Leucobacter musarum]
MLPGFEPTPQANRRAELRTAGDDQASQTRSRLIAAFREAAAARTPRLSATWLCERSGVGRSTYYTHFATVDELAAEAITDALSEISETDIARRTGVHSRRDLITRDGLRRLIAELERARPLLDYAFTIGSRAQIFEHLVTRFEALTRRTVEAEFQGADDATISITTSFVSAGTVHALLRWLSDRDPAPAETVVHTLTALLPPELTTDADPGEGHS